MPGWKKPTKSRGKNYPFQHTPRVRDLIKKYDPSLKNKIEHYLKNSLLDLNERCLLSRESAASNTTSQCSDTTENNIDIKRPTISMTVKGDQTHFTPDNPVDVRPLTITTPVKETLMKGGNTTCAKNICDFQKPLFDVLPIKNNINESYSKKRPLQSHVVPEASKFVPLMSETHPFRRPL